jgi:CRISP-associated protein Cas1
LASSAALRVRQGALEIDHGAQGDKQSIRVDIDETPPRAILFDGRGEFLTGEAIRWCAQRDIALILPEGPGRMVTFSRYALEAGDGAAGLPDTNPPVIRAQCAADTLKVAREIVRAKIEAEASHVGRFDPFNANAVAEWISGLDSAMTVPQLVMIEARAASCYWRAFRGAGLREAKGGNLARSWLRFSNRQKGAGFLGSKHASHPINAMLNYAYVVEAGRLAKALAARGLALPIGFLHSDKTGRNSLVWDAIEPLRPAIDARVFSFIASREFARSDFLQTGVSTFRLERDIIGSILDRASLSDREIADAADFMLQTIERYAGGDRTLFKADMRRGKHSGRRRLPVIRDDPKVPVRAGSELATIAPDFQSQP